MELLERFAQGDDDAFETLFRQFQGEVYGWILRIVREPAAAEELTIETFWKIYRARRRFRAGGSFGAWARRIGTNAALDHLRRRRRVEELPEDIAGGECGDPAVERETREEIRRAFRRLPAKLLGAATLALIEEPPYEEIADALGISAGAARLRVHRAVRILRSHLARLGRKP